MCGGAREASGEVACRCEGGGVGGRGRSREAVSRLEQLIVGVEADDQVGVDGVVREGGADWQRPGKEACELQIESAGRRRLERRLGGPPLSPRASRVTGSELAASAAGASRAKVRASTKNPAAVMDLKTRESPAKRSTAQPGIASRTASRTAVGLCGAEGQGEAGLSSSTARGVGGGRDVGARAGAPTGKETTT